MRSSTKLLEKRGLGGWVWRAPALAPCREIRLVRKHRLVVRPQGWGDPVSAIRLNISLSPLTSRRGTLVIPCEELTHSHPKHGRITESYHLLSRRMKTKYSSVSGGASPARNEVPSLLGEGEPRRPGEGHARQALSKNDNYGTLAAGYPAVTMAA